MPVFRQLVYPVFNLALFALFTSPMTRFSVSRFWGSLVGTCLYLLATEYELRAKIYTTTPVRK